MHTLYVILKKDIVTYYRGISWILIVALYFLTSVFFTATALGGLVEVARYFQFVAVGMIIIGLYNTSFLYMNVVSGETRRGYIKYLLALPFNRSGLAIGRMFAGMLRGVTFSIFMLIITFPMIGFPSVTGAFLLAVAIFCVAFSFTGLGLAITVYLKPTLVDPFSDIIGMYLVFTSTIYYPADIMPVPLKLASAFNPLSAGSNVIRASLGLSALSITDLIVLLASTVFLVSLGVKGYHRKLKEPS
jgi:ABC-2 type transport system permease protein